MALSAELVRALDSLLTRAFAEEGEDVTTLAVFGPAREVSAEMVCRERAVISGTRFLPRLFSFLHPPATVETLVEDGTRVLAGTALARVVGPAVTVLAAERVALNLVQRLSGIATLTDRFRAALAGTPTRLLDTRKTAPGLRIFERYAVRCGGGMNHRFGLSRAFLVKDNHADASGGVWEATRRAADFRSLNPRLKRLLLEVEARTLDEVRQALDAGAERILLDNMPPGRIQASVKEIRRLSRARGRPVEIEASGGMTPEKARRAARAGVDYVSVGALTHSARAIDIALEVSLGPASTSGRRRPSPR